MRYQYPGGGATEEVSPTRAREGEGWETLRRYFTASCRQPHIYDQSWQGGTITHHYPTWTQVIWSINCRYAISIFSNCYHLVIWSTRWRFVIIADHYKPTCVLLIELTQLNLSVLLHYKYNIYWYLFLNHIIHLSIILGLLYEHFWSDFLLNCLYTCKRQDYLILLEILECAGHLGEAGDAGDLGHGVAVELVVNLETDEEWDQPRRWGHGAVEILNCDININQYFWK